MANELTYFIDKFHQYGWMVRIKDDHSVDLGSTVSDRYPRLPSEYLQFLMSVSECTNPLANAWFLCESNFNGQSDYETHWDEWELFDIEACKADKREVEAIRAFWDTHIPIALSVKSDFAYLAIDLGDDHFGEIVYGFAPFFLEPSAVAASFGQLLIRLTRLIGQEPQPGTDEWDLWDFT